MTTKINSNKQEFIRFIQQTPPRFKIGEIVRFSPDAIAAITERFELNKECVVLLKSLNLFILGCNAAFISNGIDIVRIDYQYPVIVFNHEKGDELAIALSKALDKSVAIEFLDVLKMTFDMLTAEELISVNRKL